MSSRLRSLRSSIHQTQFEVAASLHVSRETYAKYETGERAIPLELVPRLAEHYRVSSDYLLGLTDQPVHSPALSSSEAELLQLYRRSSERTRLSVLTLLLSQH